MNATVFSHSNIIGKTDLIIGDASMGHVFGLFIPNEYYFAHIQQDVWKIYDNTKPNYGKWDMLGLVIELETGYKLNPEGGITIDDIEDLPDEPKQVDISGLHWQVINNYFHAT